MSPDTQTLPAVYIVFGLPGSGKTYFATRWAEMIQADYASSDELRKSMYDHPAYSIAEKRSVYQQLLRKMQTAIDRCENIVLDATFSDPDTRRTFEEAAGGRAMVHFVEITTDDSITRERLQKKRLFSDADYKVYMQLKENWHGLNKQHLVLYSTQCNIDEMLRKARKYFRINKVEQN